MAITFEHESGQKEGKQGASLFVAERPEKLITTKQLVDLPVSFREIVGEVEQGAELVYAYNQKPSSVIIESTQKEIAAVLQDPEILQRQLAAIDDLVNRGELFPAEKLAKNLTDLFPQCASSWGKLSDVYYHQGRYPEALDNIFKAIDLDREFDAYHASAAYIFAYLGDSRKAKEYAQRCLDCGGQSAEVYALLGCLAREEAERDQYFMQAVDLDPKNGSICFEWAVRLEESGEFGRAIKAYNQAYELGFRDPEIFMRCGNIYLQTKQFQIAIDCFRKYLREVPDSAVGHCWLALALCLVGEYQKAQTETHLAKLFDPGGKDTAPLLELIQEQIEKSPKSADLSLVGSSL